MTQGSQPDVLNLLLPHSNDLQQTSTLQGEVIFLKNDCRNHLKPMMKIPFSKEYFLASAKHFGVLLIQDHFNPRLRLQVPWTKRATPKELDILGRGKSLPVHNYPEDITLWGYLCKEGREEFKQISQSSLQAGFGFYYRPSPQPTRPQNLHITLTNVASGSANVLRSKVASSTRLLSLSSHILLDFGLPFQLL